MGVKHLWSILEPACKQGSYEDLSGKTAAVDLSIWIIECRSIPKANRRNSLHLRTLFFRVLNMIYFNIKPIFVLDSTNILDLKLDTVAKRLGLKIDQTKHDRSNFNLLINECSELLSYLGLPIIRANGEAEKLCAQMNQMNIVDVVITNDSDCLVYGANILIRNFGIDVKSMSFDIYDRRDIETTCHLNQRSLLTLALLLGSDYDTNGIFGIGKENALKFLQTIPTNTDPIDYLRTIFIRNKAENKYEQKILNILQQNKQTLKRFDRIIEEYSKLELDNLPLIKSIASIKWLKPVQLKNLQSYMKKKLGWMECYTFLKVFPLLTRFQILYRLNMIELDVDDVLSLSDTTIFQPMYIHKIRIRQSKQYYEVEWKQHDLPSTQTLDENMANLSLVVLNDEDDDDDKLITIEPADLFRHAYPEIVQKFEKPITKLKKAKKQITSSKNDEIKNVAKKRKMKQTSTSMSLDLLSVIDHEKCEKLEEKVNLKNENKRFNHRPTMAALSTSMNIDVLSVLQKSHDNINKKSRTIKHLPHSDMNIKAKKPATLLNTSLSLDVLDIILREKQQMNDDEDCTITDVIISKPIKNAKRKLNNVVQLLSSEQTDNDDDDDDENNANANVLPLPLWDRIRQRNVIQSNF